MNELHRYDGRNVLVWAEDGGRGVSLSDLPNPVLKHVSAAQMQFTHATRSPRARQIAGRAVCGSKVDIIAGIRARDSAALEKSFLELVFEVLCGATATLVQPLDCRPPHSLVVQFCERTTVSYRSEIAECFVLLPVVYLDGTFKTTPLTL